MNEDGDWYRGRTAYMTVDYSDIDGSINRLLPLLDDEDGTCHGAMLGIRSVALHDQRGVDLLLQLLEHERPRIRTAAVSSLIRRQTQWSRSRGATGRARYEG